MKIRFAAISLAMLCLLAGCGFMDSAEQSPSPEPSPSEDDLQSPSPSSTPFSTKDPEGMTIAGRFSPPPGFEREDKVEGSFAEWLGNLQLKPDDALVYLFDGTVKPDARFEAVLRVDVGTRDLLQSTRLLICLRAGYLYEQKRYEDIVFHFLSGFACSFDKWSDGYRTKVTGNTVEWVKTDEPDASQAVFDKYLTNLYVYSNATALAQDVVASPDMAIGDVFLKNGGAIIADMCRDSETGRTAVLLVRGGSPTQNAYVVQNAENPELSPWFIIPDSGPIVTPEGDFLKSEAMRFKT